MSKILIIMSLIFMGCQTAPKYSKAIGQSDTLEVVTSDDSRSSFNVKKRQKLVAKSLKKAELKSQKNKSTNEDYLELAKLAILSGDYTKAINYSKKSIKLNLDSPNEARKVLFKAYIESDQTNLAKLVASTLGGVGSKDVQVLNGIGLISLRENNIEESIFIFESVLKLDAKNLAARLNLGSIYTQIQNYDKAQDNFSYVLKRWPDNIDAKLGLATVYNDISEFYKASALFSQVLRVDPSNEIALFNGGYSFYRVKHLNKAKKNLLKFNKISKKKSEIQSSLKLLTAVNKQMIIEKNKKTDRIEISPSSN